jgi:hypothetical protein
MFMAIRMCIYTAMTIGTMTSPMPTSMNTNILMHTAMLTATSIHTIRSFMPVSMNTPERIVIMSTYMQWMKLRGMITFINYQGIHQLKI